MCVCVCVIWIQHVGCCAAMHAYIRIHYVFINVVVCMHVPQSMSLRANELNVCAYACMHACHAWMYTHRGVNVRGLARRVTKETKPPSRRARADPSWRFYCRLCADVPFCLALLSISPPAASTDGGRGHLYLCGYPHPRAHLDSYVWPS